MRVKNSIVFILAVCFSFSIQAQTTETRDLSAFSTISISGGFDKVLLREGKKESIEITVKGIEAEKIITEVKRDGLKVGMKNVWNQKYKATLVITYVKIEELNNSGSSDIFTEQPIKCNVFAANFSGSGDLHAEFEVHKLDMHISGSSDMELKGSAMDQEYAISGSGDVDASNLSGETADVAISGSGDVKLHVSGKVHSAVSGSGDVINNH